MPLEHRRALGANFRDHSSLWQKWVELVLEDLGPEKSPRVTITDLDGFWSKTAHI